MQSDNCLVYENPYRHWLQIFLAIEYRNFNLLVLWVHNKRTELGREGLGWIWGFFCVCACGRGGGGMTVMGESAILNWILHNFFQSFLIVICLNILCCKLKFLNLDAFQLSSIPVFEEALWRTSVMVTSPLFASDFIWQLKLMFRYH